MQPHDFTVHPDATDHIYRRACGGKTDEKGLKSFYLILYLCIYLERHIPILFTADVPVQPNPKCWNLGRLHFLNPDFFEYSTLYIYVSNEGNFIHLEAG